MKDFQFMPFKKRAETDGNDNDDSVTVVVKFDARWC